MKSRLPAPLKWQPVTAARHATPEIVLRKTGKRLLRQIKGNVPGVLAGRDPEYLHQLRVAVRRLRVLLPLTRGLYDERRRRQITRQLKALARVLGPARDSDVFIADIWPQLRAVIGNGRWVQRLDAEWLAQRQRNRIKLRRTLATRRFGALLSALEGYFAAPGLRDADTRGVRHGMRFSKKVLRRRAQRVRERFRDAHDTHDEASAHGQALHRLRIAIKKLRYELDFLAPLMQGRPAHKVGARLAGLQDILGTLNDVATAATQVETALRRDRGAEAARLREALQTWRKAQDQGLQRKFSDAWKAWRKVNPYR